MKQSEYLALRQGDHIVWNGAKDHILKVEKIVPEEMYIYTQHGGRYFWIDCAVAQFPHSSHNDSCVDSTLVQSSCSIQTIEHVGSAVARSEQYNTGE